MFTSVCSFFDDLIQQLPMRRQHILVCHKYQANLNVLLVRKAQKHVPK